VEALRRAGEGARVRAVVATQNANKLRELREALAGWELEPLEVDGWPEETGDSYLENARAKARFGRALAPAEVWVLGEDSGIECDALDGAPGLRSARWSPRGDQADALVERLAAEPDRRARMVAELVAIAPDGEEFRGRGVLEGSIARERRGEGGFGYDPVFVPHGQERTVAELGEAWKRDHSHRGRAASSLAAAVAGAPSPS
jgi:XTP/dITP diphosphohydrolase